MCAAFPVDARVERDILGVLRCFPSSHGTGFLGRCLSDAGRLLAIWNVRVARDLAWNFADHLRGLEGVRRDLGLEAQDKLTGVIGRALLLAA